jgi:hypothetical protein
VTLLADLRAAFSTVDPQFTPTSNELIGVVAGLALYQEFGDAFLEAATEGGIQAVTDLISGQQAETSPEDKDKADAEASRRATAQQTRSASAGSSSSGKDKS